MGRLGKKALSFFLVLVPIYVHGAPWQDVSPIVQRKPFFERLRRLEEQFRRFQEVTLTHLQGIPNNYNVSYNVDTRFRSLAEESQALAVVVNRSQAAVQGDMAHLKTWMRKAQRRSRKANARLQALDLALSTRSRQWAQEEKEQKAQRQALASLTLDLRALQDALSGLVQQVNSQSTRLAALEGHLQLANPGNAALGVTPAPTPTQLQRGPGSLQMQRDSRAPQHRSSPQDFAARFQGKQKPQILDSRRLAPEDTSQPEMTHQAQRDLCRPGPVLVFPNASIENAIVLRPGFLTPLRALSFCSWVRTASGHLGTLLSYATEDNDNKLVLHGRSSLDPGSIHFVIGDPAFRELSLQLLLDGQWHHICVVWTSIEGRYRLHVDRRLVATGSRFREGYEIPPGGSLVLGQEQDTVGGGFDSTESFVGSIAGLAIWDRALAPGEIANLAAGKELPTGAILTLANALPLRGFVQRANCTCLEHCPGGRITQEPRRS